MDARKKATRNVWVCVAAAILFILGASAWLWRRGRESDATGVTPYRNTRAGVKYVGDAACVECHRAISESYQSHSMGRSLYAINEDVGEDQGTAEERLLFESQGFQYSLQKRDGKTFHRELRRDKEGQLIGAVEGEVKYVLGSGTRAKAFLFERDGYLFQSPVTWYAQNRGWDLAPGYERREGRFERQITPGCLTCHANQAEHVAGTEGRYRPPTFRGHAIGCERCHGPGALHVANPQDAAAGPNIVNPVDLKLLLREDVCQQCHLLGEATIDRRGHALADYRPGLALSDFVTVFSRPPGLHEGHTNGDHVEQMSRSRCFRASDGALGCVSCHDPHRLPAPESKVAYYEERCLACHADRGCALSPLERNERGNEHDCIFCHMPRVPTSDVRHLATTLHSIPRDRERARAQTAAGSSQPIDGNALVPFHRDRMSARRRADADRDLGVALRQRGRRGATKALPLLSRALSDHPDDLLARESFAFALWGLGRDREALETFETVLRAEPNRESALEAAALLAGDLGTPDAAVSYWRRAIAVDPWRSSFHAELAGQLVRLNQWPEAVSAAERALAINPASVKARLAQVAASHRAGNSAEARARFDSLLGFDPPDREAIIRWYEALR
jgi:tetratricopeptide (TPR) repeat protein